MGNIKLLVSADKEISRAAITERFKVFVERWFPGTVVECLAVPEHRSVYSQLELGWWPDPSPDIVFLHDHIIDGKECLELCPDLGNWWAFAITNTDEVPLEFLDWADDGTKPVSLGALYLRIALDEVLSSGPV